MSRTDSWLCPLHGDSTSLTACLRVDCWAARLAGASPDMLAALELIVEAHEANDKALLASYVNHARGVIRLASPVSEGGRSE